MELVEYRVEQLEQEIAKLQELAPLAIIGFIAGTLAIVFFFMCFTFKKTIFEDDK